MNTNHDNCEGCGAVDCDLAYDDISDEDYGPDELPPAGGPTLGRCCICEGTDNVTNVMMLDRRAPTPGTGWGCLQCNRPLDGAVAVVCDHCLAAQAALKFVCDGPPGHDKRVPIEGITEAFGHDLSQHPEVVN